MTPQWTRFYASAPTLSPTAVSAPEAFERAVSTFGPKTAVEMVGKSLTYSQLGQRVRALAQGLLDSGVRAGDRVAIVLPMSIDAVAAFHAVLRIGAVAVQHSARAPMVQLARLFTDYTPVAAFMAESRLDALAGIDKAALPKTIISVPRPEEPRALTRLTLTGALTSIAQATGRSVSRMTSGAPASLAPSTTQYIKLKELTASPPLPDPHPFPRSSDLATILYPSKERRAPMGAMLTHSNLTALARQSLEWMGGSRPGKEVDYALWPLHSFTGIADTLTASLFHGRHTILFPRFDEALIAKALRKSPPTVVSGDVHVFEFLADLAEAGTAIPPIRFAFTRLENSRHIRRWVERLGSPVVVGYGNAESCVISGLPMPVSGHEDSVGVPFPSTMVRVVDPHNRGRVLPPGEVGRLMIKGPQVFHGYWNHPDETAAVLSADGWVLTDDLASVDSEGFVTLAS